MIPDIKDHRWDNLILGKGHYQFHLLSVKILMNRTFLSIQQDPSPTNAHKCKQELYDFFVKNERIAQKDIAQIFSRELL